MKRPGPHFARTIPALILATFAAALAWEMVLPGRIYHCTDSVGFDFFTPGAWVHGDPEVVESIDHNRPMSSRDTIKEGWTEAGLWSVWGAMVGSILAIGWLSARRGRKSPMPSALLLVAVAALPCLKLGSCARPAAAPTAASAATARLVAEEVCVTYCRDFHIHPGTLNREPDGGFDVSGRSWAGGIKEFRGELGQRLAAVGWHARAYQMQLEDPAAFLVKLGPSR